MTLKSKIYIVGAGPGDPDLLTVKAARLIQQADVILHDRLVNPQILELARPDCKFVDVGKEAGKLIIEQEKINNLLVSYYEKAKTIVRLKGGDPFVFGRGGEEALFLAKKNIPFEVVPGVSSALSVPICAGIPITHRKLSSSFAVIAGHQTPRAKNKIYWQSFKGIDTLIFLMGVKNRQDIAKNLMAIGRSPNEPVAFIEKGTTKDQRVILSTLKKVMQNPPAVKSPAIFMVGQVVTLHGAFSPLQTKKNRLS